MKKAIFALLLCTATASAADNGEKLLSLRAEARFDYQRDWNDWHTVSDNTGFTGKYLNLRADGTLTHGLTYSWRQRFNKPHSDSSFFDATDWLYLNYSFGDWSIAGGKQVVAIGGWEYDRAPIDLYSCSVFWNNIPCYAIGGSLSYSLTGNDRLTVQMCESPFFTKENRDMYGYNLMWTGSHGCYQSLWSVNLLEYTPGHYINYIALGNRFTAGKWRVDIDLMNRSASHQTFLLKDCSVMGEIAYCPGSRWQLHGKVTYDINHSGTDADLCVLNGTELTMAGAGLEYYPILEKKHSLRLHANMYYSWGKNANSDNVMQNRTAIFDLGVKWSMDLLSFTRK